ncbi:transposase [Mangrovicoccus sp. HB182678]|uniref:Transposase n=1 Tax=Mangrovicoccus algicola TaxID=2771008 RepID=A0A8J6YZC5_9RHOB|nr:transposase [Mangrovicoccus algicola]
MALDALKSAIASRNPAPGLIHHSDSGNCYDNSMVEKFSKTIKARLIRTTAWQTRRQAENAIARYIDGFHNPVRQHSSLGYLSLIASGRKAREVSETLPETRAGPRRRMPFAQRKPSLRL